MEQPKYCPHCGGDAILTANYSPKAGVWFINVKCTFCGATGKYYTQKEAPDKSGWTTDVIDYTISYTSYYTINYTKKGGYHAGQSYCRNRAKRGHW